ncbi:MAG: glycosyltransferase, partial [Thermodesulfovibrionia bacterium]|nr:glycosyltransferase [Thermodesulfovibrionia bacterium]
MATRRILYILGEMDIGGTEGHVATLVRGLDQRLFEPFVFVLGDVADHWRDCLGKQLLTATPKGVKKKYGLLGHLLWLRRFLVNTDIEIVQSFFCIENLLTLMAASRLPCRTVISKRNLMPNGYSFILRLAARLFFSKYDGALANSKAVRDRSVMYDGIPAK